MVEDIYWFGYEGYWDEYWYYEECDGNYGFGNFVEYFFYGFVRRKVFFFYFGVNGFYYYDGVIDYDIDGEYEGKECN